MLAIGAVRMKTEVAEQSSQSQQIQRYWVLGYNISIGRFLRVMKFILQILNQFGRFYLPFSRVIIFAVFKHILSYVTAFEFGCYLHN